MGGDEPQGTSNGAACTSAGECKSKICAKPCKIPSAQWGRIKDVDHWNRLGFCKIPEWHQGSFACMASYEYSGQILLNADGSINYRGKPAGIRSRWNKDQCIKGVNCKKYEKTTTGTICAGKFWLKGAATSSKAACEKNCGGRAGCHTFCWSDSSPEWDCLMYKDCSSVSSRFNSGNPTTSYSCYEKKSTAGEQALSLNMADEQAASLTMVDAAAPEINTLAVDLFALIGLLAVLLLVVRMVARSVTKPLSTVKETFTTMPTEKTPLEGNPNPTI